MSTEEVGNDGLLKSSPIAAGRMPTWMLGLLTRCFRVGVTPDPRVDELDGSLFIGKGIDFQRIAPEVTFLNFPVTGFSIKLRNKADKCVCHDNVGGN